jgi:hypothetical protein
MVIINTRLKILDMTTCRVNTVSLVVSSTLIFSDWYNFTGSWVMLDFATDF